jgi:hypothetical protein
VGFGEEILFFVRLKIISKKIEKKNYKMIKIHKKIKKT